MANFRADLQSEAIGLEAAQALLLSFSAAQPTQQFAASSRLLDLKVDEVQEKKCQGDHRGRR
jgi:hypothetical protein